MLVYFNNSLATRSVYYYFDFVFEFIQILGEMSFRSNFSHPNNTVSSFNANINLQNANNSLQSSNIAFQRNIPNDFASAHYPNSSTTNRYPLSSTNPFGSTKNINDANQFYNAPYPRLPVTAPPPLSHPNLTNTPPNLPNFAHHLSNASLSYSQRNEQSCNRNVVTPVISNSNIANFNFDQRNINIQRPPAPLPNLGYNNLSPNINYAIFQNNEQRFNNTGNMPINLPSLPQFPASVSQNATNALNSPANYSVRNISNPVSQDVVYTSPSAIKHPMVNASQSSAMLQNSSFLQVPLHLLQNESSESKNLNRHSNPVLFHKEREIAQFLAKFSVKKIENKYPVTIPEFRYVIKAAIRMVGLLNERKRKLSNLLNATDSEWIAEVKTALNEQEELSTLCSFLSDPDHLKNVIKKLALIKKRRERKKKTKQNKLSEKKLAEQKRRERDQEIDKWLDNIKEKNEKIKREAELKKEADFILLEVRRKIYEANKTIEKIKVFEKLRDAIKVHASQKGLHVLSMHNVKFEKKMYNLRELMTNQLADYEAEEKALKVMLETEQEGQREEEVQWKIRKMKSLQQNRHDQILECLFGISDDPLPTDPLYFFQKFHTSATNSIENLVQIRKQWDKHLSEDGEVIPQQWIAPVAPSNASWEQCLVTLKN